MRGNAALAPLAVVTFMAGLGWAGLRRLATVRGRGSAHAFPAHAECGAHKSLRATHQAGHASFVTSGRPA
jgi:hypothetical protein